MLELQNLNFKVKRKHILSDVTLSLDHSVYGLIGSNGSGKTTLMRCIAGIYKLTGGSINASERIGYLPQKYGTFGELTVYETLDYYATLKKIPKKEKEQQIRTALEQVKLVKRSNDKAKTLSGGMVRRLGIAQAILGNPEILLFDEPTVGLDQETREDFLKLIAQIKKGKTILISTHILEDAREVCEYIIHLESGHVDECKKVSNFYGVGGVSDNRKEQ